MQEIIVDVINQYGYLGVFLLIAIENIFPPIPSEIILTFSGFMTTYSEINVWGVIFFATLGSVVGAVLLYSLGRLLTPQRIVWLLDSKPVKMLRLKRGDIKRAEGWFQKRGNVTVFFCRFIPIIRSFISVPAGIAKMPLRAFLPLTVAGTFIWNTVLIFLGRFAGNAWGKIAHYFDVYSLVAAVVLIAAAAVLGVIFLKRRFLRH